MKKKTRLIILSLFIILFILTVPVVILYTEGYRYNFKKGKIEKTGAFVFVTEPRDVNIYIDNTLYPKNKEFLIQKISPQSHAIKILKRGYYPWSKNLEVKPNLTTFVNTVKLVKKGLPISILSEEIKQIHYAPNKKELIYLASKTLWYFDLISQKKEKALTIPNHYQLEQIIWSKDSQKILVILKNKASLIYSIISPEDLDQKLYLHPEKELNQVKWDSPKSPFLIALENHQKLVRLDTQTGNRETVLKSQGVLIDFFIDPKGIYILENPPQNTQTDLLVLDFDFQEQNRFPLPYSNEYQFGIEHEHYLIIQDNALSITYFFDKQKKEPPLIEILPASDECLAYYRPNEFICYNNYEIKVFAAHNNTKHLLIRFSHPISELVVHEDSPYLTVLIDNTIKIIEVDLVSQKNIVDLNEMKNIHSLIQTDTDKNLYFYGEIGNQNGLYKYELY